MQCTVSMPSGFHWRIERRALDGTVGGIEDALLADLEQQLAAVMGKFLNDAGGSCRDPEIVVLVEVATVQARVEKLRVTPRVDNVAGGVELDDRRGQAPRMKLRFQNILPVENDHVVLG